MLLLKYFLVVGCIGFYATIGFAQDVMEEAQLSISFSEENDLKIITTKATDQAGMPIEDLEIYFYVQRTFSLLPIGDGFNATDENGLLEIEFPNDLPGDEEGNLIIITKIIESDIYNDQTLKNTKKWGVPVVYDDPKTEKRSLWAAAANAPVSLIILVSTMILAVWYIIFFIFYMLYRISKIKPTNN